MATAQQRRKKEKSLKNKEKNTPYTPKLLSVLFLMRLLYNALMKIRYYDVNRNRWWGFAIAMASIFILSDARWFYNNIAQMLGWSLASISCGIWVYIGMKDKDVPRTLMELVYFILALRAVYNWIG